MKPLDFFASHPVFTHDEFSAQVSEAASPQTRKNVLAYHVRRGRLVRVRRGLYASVPRGVEASSFDPDPYLIATRLAPDATVAYHAALQFRGRTYSVWHRFHFVTATWAKGLSFRGSEFIPVQLPASLRRLPDQGTGVADERHADGTVRTTTFERSLVDLLDAPDLGGGWEEVWRSLEMVEFFDLDAVTAYALALGSALTVARVGFYLEQHRTELMVEDRHLERLRAHAPKQAAYFDPPRKPGKLVKGWNLVVPDYVLRRSWGEVL
ncbi:MAG: type IV toxin-antitoxin system AbiEi family antitoxin domain-containing protein [Thermoanaerobaculia bacterium]